MVYNLTIYQDWDILKKRCVPQTSQEFVDSKQRLRAALRNIKTITEISQKNGYRKYMITDSKQSDKKLKRNLQLYRGKREKKFRDQILHL
ncbi:hypothetical protein TNCT_162331, partial [Trichonephila clavata]